MGQQIISTIPNVNNNPPINFDPQINQFEAQYIQKVKETPFISSKTYSSNPQIYFQPVDMSLQSLVAPRLNTMKLFPKQEISKIIQNLFTGLQQLQKRNFQNYGNISLSNIYYSKQSKTFKLINPAFHEESNYFLVKEAKKFCFLAPQQLIDLTDNSQTQTIIDFKTDIFILAVCLLQICTLKDSRQIYCQETYNIFDGKVKQRLKQVEQFYSQQIARFIELCLQYDFDKRISLNQILKLIKSFKQGPVEKLTNQLAQSKVGSKMQIKKGSLPFGPSHLPKRINPTN